MRFAVLSDVHGNLLALEAVLEHFKGEGIERLYCAGDLVGYGPWPNEVIELLRSRCCSCVQGNHDAAVAGRISTTLFNRAAAEAIEWTKTVLSEESRSFLKELPEVLD